MTQTHDLIAQLREWGDHAARFSYLGIHRISLLGTVADHLEDLHRQRTTLMDDKLALESQRNDLKDALDYRTAQVGRYRVRKARTEATISQKDRDLADLRRETTQMAEILGQAQATLEWLKVYQPSHRRLERITTLLTRISQMIGKGEEAETDQDASGAEMVGESPIASEDGPDDGVEAKTAPHGWEAAAQDEANAKVDLAIQADNVTWLRNQVAQRDDELAIREREIAAWRREAEILRAEKADLKRRVEDMGKAQEQRAAALRAALQSEAKVRKHRDDLKQAQVDQIQRIHDLERQVETLTVRLDQAHQEVLQTRRSWEMLRTPEDQRLIDNLNAQLALVRLDRNTLAQILAGER